LSKSRRVHSFLQATPLLPTEVVEQFESIRDALRREINPRGIVDQIYVIDVAYLTWEILRLRRCKAGIINSALRPALEELLKRLFEVPIGSKTSTDDARELSYGWFSDPVVKQEVLEILTRFQLDESAIEAEAIRLRSADLDLLDRLQASLESRRNKALRFISDFGADWARRLRERSDQIIDGKVLTQDNSRSKASTAAA
jgi:hypothetical protein